MVRLVSYLIASMIATLVVGSLSEQRLVRYESRTAVFIFALILGVLNAYIKPVLRILTLPLTCLTFGLFSLVLNTALFALAAWLTPGMEITFWGAVFGSIIVSVASGIIFSVLDEK